jgi:hypothetical protein
VTFASALAVCFELQSLRSLSCCCPRCARHLRPLATLIYLSAYSRQCVGGHAACANSSQQRGQAACVTSQAPCTNGAHATAAAHGAADSCERSVLAAGANSVPATYGTVCNLMIQAVFANSVRTASADSWCKQLARGWCQQRVRRQPSGQLVCPSPTTRNRTYGHK